jgi:hypothetical protein
VADGKLRRRRFTPAEDEAILLGRQATPRVPFLAIAREMGRNEQAVRSRAWQLGCVKAQTADAGSSARRQYAKTIRGPNAPAPRRCLNCRAEFHPPTRFYFLCETHRRGE